MKGTLLFLCNDDYGLRPAAEAAFSRPLRAETGADLGIRTLVTEVLAEKVLCQLHDAAELI
jgi:hypothetical protein